MKPISRVRVERSEHGFQVWDFFIPKSPLGYFIQPKGGGAYHFLSAAPLSADVLKVVADLLRQINTLLTTSHKV
jgi:hypothetical protein